jgi:hypothetical protein
VRRYAWVPFAVALAAFVLPFATVSCGELHVEPSGADLVLHTPPETEGSNPQGIDLGALVVAHGGGLATAAFLAFALALLASVRAWDDGWALLGAITGVTALLVLKTRTGGSAEGVIEVDASAGAFLAAGAAAVGALLLAPRTLRTASSLARPAAPFAGALLVLAGYLLPAQRSAVISASYADSLTVRQPWISAFWLLPVAASLVLLARRRELTPDLSTVTLAVFAPTAVVFVHEIWMLWRDEARQPGVGPFLMLGGIVLSAAWAFSARRGRAGRPAGTPPRLAPARAPASPPDAPSAPGAAGSPPAAP